MVQRDELEIILEVWSFGMLGGSTFLGQATLSQAQIGRLLGRGASELSLTAKPKSEQLEAEITGGALCGALPASGAPATLDDASQTLEDMPDVRRIEKGRLTIELKSLTSKRTLLKQQPRQSMFNIMRHSMESFEHDLVNAASEAISPTHASSAGGGEFSDGPALNGNASDQASAPEAAAQNGAERAPSVRRPSASERFANMFSRSGSSNDDAGSASGSRRSRRKSSKSKKLRINLGSSSRTKSQSGQR